MKSVRIVLLAFFGIGLLCLAGAATFTLHTSRFVERAKSAYGTVVELREKRDSDGDTLYTRWSSTLRRIPRRLHSCR